MSLPPSSDGGARQTVRCVDCLFWMPPAKTGEGHHCFLTLRVIPRRKAAACEHCCPAYVDRYDVVAAAASDAWTAGRVRREEMP